MGEVGGQQGQNDSAERGHSRSPWLTDSNEEGKTVVAKNGVAKASAGQAKESRETAEEAGRQHGQNGSAVRERSRSPRLSDSNKEANTAACDAGDACVGKPGDALAPLPSELIPGRYCAACAAILNEDL